MEQDRKAYARPARIGMDSWVRTRIEGTQQTVKPLPEASVIPDVTPNLTPQVPQEDGVGEETNSGS